jgi:hypothetical protein
MCSRKGPSRSESDSRNFGRIRGHCIHGKIGDTQIVGNVLIPLDFITSISSTSSVIVESSTSLSELARCQSADSVRPRSSLRV